MKNKLLVFSILFPCWLYPQFNVVPHLQTGAYSRDFRDPLSGMENIAALSSLEKFSAGLCLSRNPSLPELQQIIGIAAIPIVGGTLGITARFRGKELYRESSIGLGYAKDLGKLSVAGKICYNRSSILRYGSSGSLSVDMGILVFLTDKLYSGFQISNPNRGTLSGQKTPLLINTGLGYTISSGIFVTAELIKSENLPAFFKTVLLYNSGKAFNSAIGMISEIQLLFVRAGWQFNTFRLSIGVSIHSEFGNTPEFIFHYLNSTE